MNTFFIDKSLKRGVSGHESQKIKKKSISRFTEITTKIEDWKLKFAIFEDFTNHGKSIRDINRGSREQKKYDGRGNSDYPNHRSWTKMVKERKKWMRGSEKGS